LDSVPKNNNSATEGTDSEIIVEPIKVYVNIDIDGWTTEDYLIKIRVNEKGSDEHSEFEVASGSRIKLCDLSPGMYEARAFAPILLDGTIFAALPPIHFEINENDSLHVMKLAFVAVLAEEKADLLIQRAIEPWQNAIDREVMRNAAYQKWHPAWTEEIYHPDEYNEIYHPGDGYYAAVCDDCGDTFSLDLDPNGFHLHHMFTGHSNILVGVWHETSPSWVDSVLIHSAWTEYVEHQGYWE